MIVEDMVPLAPASLRDIGHDLGTADSEDIGHDREWWASESARAGSDWPRVIRTAVDMLTMAGLIAPEPSTFQEACERVDLVFALRRGVGALDRPDTQRRLSDLDESQLEAVCLRVQAFKAGIAPPWSAEDVDRLISAWGKLREQR
jgi:hypothetical protein